MGPGPIPLLLAGAFVGVQQTMGRRRDQGPGGLAGLRRDLRSTLQELGKRTSAAHKRMVLLVILVGAALRIWMLLAPVTNAEAFTVVHFATGDWAGVFSDRTLPGNHILHTALVKCCLGLFGPALWSVRAPDLVAGILCLPLLYVFVRAMFNRYVALLALALAAAAPQLVLFSALSEGVSIGWFLFLLALNGSRHLVKRNNPITALLVGLLLALLIWNDPGQLQVALMVLLWIPAYLMSSYETSLAQRMGRYAIVPLTALVAGIVLFLPVIIAHGVGQVFDPGLGTEPVDWASFSAGHQEAVLALWEHLSAPYGMTFSLLALGGQFVAVYLSGKYRLLVAAMAIGGLAAVFLRLMVPAPEDWTYMVLVFHLGTALLLFYLLKLVQDHLWAGFAKRMRTMAGALLMMVLGTALTLGRGTEQLVVRYAEADVVVRQLRSRIADGSGVVLAQPPWHAPVGYYLYTRDMDPRRFAPAGRPKGTGINYVLVAPSDGQDLNGVLRHHELDPLRTTSIRKLQDLQRSEIFAVRMEPVAR